MKSFTNIATTILLCAASTILAADWPQYAGPNFDRSTGEKINRHWPASGPRQVWKIPFGPGFSSFAVAGDKAFSVAKRSIDGVAREVCVALDANSGRELWAVPVGIAKYDGGGDSGAGDNRGGDGPRSTPAVDGDRVYVTTAHLSLFCLDARDGKVIWSRDILKEHEGRNISWQNAASPLVDGDFVFMAGGGAGQALLGIDKRTGKTVWKAQNDRMTHATPVAAVIHGVRQVIFFTQSGLVAVTPAAGAVLWRHPFKYSTSTAASPVVAGDIVFCSAGYGVGGGAARITKSGSSFKAEELWRITGNGFNHWSTPVHKDGYLYGMFGFKEYGQCPLKCVDIKTGKAVWSKEGFGPGNVILVDGNVLALGDAGQLVLVEGTAAGYNELARTEAVAGKCWSTPVMANGRAYVRSTKEAACLDLSPGIATAD